MSSCVKAWAHILSFIMFEKFTKKVASKATDSAVDGVKETLNDKLETYSGIIKIGLTLAVIIFGSIKINDHKNTSTYNLPSGHYHPQVPQPIIINNYITDGRQAPYGNRTKQNGKKN